MGDHFIDADVGLDPPFVGFLVDLALANDEARVQPAVIAADLGEELDSGKDGPTDAGSGLFLDALAVHRDQDLSPVLSANDAPKVGCPDAILSPARKVGPSNGPSENIS